MIRIRVSLLALRPSWDRRDWEEAMTRRSRLLQDARSMSLRSIWSWRNMMDVTADGELDTLKKLCRIVVVKEWEHLWRIQPSFSMHWKSSYKPAHFMWAIRSSNPLKATWRSMQLAESNILDLSTETWCELVSKLAGIAKKRPPCHDKDERAPKSFVLHRAYSIRLKWHGKVDPRCRSDRGSSEFHRRIHLQTSSHCRQRGAFPRGCSSKESLGLKNPLQTKLFPVEHHHLSILSDILRWKKSALILQRHTCSLFLVPFLGLRGTFRSSSMVFCAVSDWKLLADGQDNWEDELEDDDLTKARTCDIFYHFPWLHRQMSGTMT